MNDPVAELINKQLDRLVRTQFASPEVLEREQKMRPSLLKAVRSERSGSFELGRWLHEYQNLLKGGLNGLAEALCISRSTANRARNRYRKAIELSETVREVALFRGYDIAAPENAALLNTLKGESFEGLIEDQIAVIVDKHIATFVKARGEAKKAKHEKKLATLAAKEQPVIEQEGPTEAPMHKEGTKRVFLSTLSGFVEQVVDMGLTKEEGWAQFSLAWEQRHNATKLGKAA